ncbi:MAG: hypothetical protein M1812_006928 [Candelaria pacifica]|nr:MAG: hypothetical protein M1812_006928 [Candelaria pacifica]
MSERLLRSVAYPSRCNVTVKSFLTGRYRNNVSLEGLLKRLSSSSSKPPLALEDETMTLSNGHTMGYSMCGSTSHSAPTIFFFHGFPSSRLEGLGLRKVAQSIGVRIITPDRPGIGLSTHDPHRTFLDYPDHIAQLARHHGLSKYHVIGGSGGGPYALACAKSLPPQSLKGVGILAGVGPMDHGMGRENMRFGTRAIMLLNQWLPELVRWYMDRSFVPMTQNPDTAIMRKFIAKQFKRMKTSEREYLESDPEFPELLIRILREHFKQGAAGNLKDIELITKPWGFRLEDVRFKGIRLWYGANDINTPAKMGVEMTKRLKNARLKIYAEDTHLTMSRLSLDILKDLMKGPPEPDREDEPEIEIIAKESSHGNA